jgi:hypothetical protein
MAAKYLSLLLALPTAITATLDCAHVRIDKQDFNLSPLSGPKTVHWQQYEPPTISNTTFTLDICNRLPQDSNTPRTHRCPAGTQVCAVREGYEVGHDGKGNVEQVIPIAGEFTTSHGRGLEPTITRLKGGDSHEDADREGIRIELHGGKYPENKQGLLQKTIIEFLCDKNVSGTEGFEEKKDKREVRAKEEEGNGDGDGDGDEDDVKFPELDKGKSLKFVSYKNEKKGDAEVGVLRLSWDTKYACEGVAETAPEAPARKSGGWGFFAWFLIMYVFRPITSPSKGLLTKCSFQPLPLDRKLHHLRLLAELQPLWRSWLGSYTPWRHNPRLALHCQGLWQFCGWTNEGWRRY